MQAKGKRELDRLVEGESRKQRKENRTNKLHYLLFTSLDLEFDRNYKGETEVKIGRNISYKEKGVG